jgi:hypothetical protein
MHLHATVEVHSIDANTRVVLNTKVNVLADTEAEVTRLGEIALLQFIFLDFQATLQDFLGLGPPDSDMNSNLFVTTDSEGTDSVASLACNGKQGISSVWPLPN